MAAMRSMTEVRKPLSGNTPNRVRGAYSLTKSAVPMDTGTATTRAMRAMVTVPSRADSTPKRGWAPVVWKPVVVKKARPIFSNAGHAWMKRNSPIRKRMRKVAPPATRTTIR
jgi:hypothetical protein